MGGGGNIVNKVDCLLHYELIYLSQTSESFMKIPCCLFALGIEGAAGFVRGRMKIGIGKPLRGGGG